MTFQRPCALRSLNPGIGLQIRCPSVTSISVSLKRTLIPRYDFQFSKDDTFIYLTAGDEAKVKVFGLPVPPTPSSSTTHPKLDSKYSIPVALTHGKAASGLQTLPGDKILFSQSSFTSPNDVYVIRDLKAVEKAILKGSKDITHVATVEKLTDFSGADLKDKGLSEGEEFWFKGALDKDVQGWTLKPKGWKVGEVKKWPAILLIHGGAYSAFSGSLAILIGFFLKVHKEHGRTNGPLAGIRTVSLIQQFVS